MDNSLRAQEETGSKKHVTVFFERILSRSLAMLCGSMEHSFFRFQSQLSQSCRLILILWKLWGFMHNCTFLCVWLISRKLETQLTDYLQRVQKLLACIPPPPFLREVSECALLFSLALFAHQYVLFTLTPSLLSFPLFYQIHS